MPRGAPRRPTNLRLDPALVAEVLVDAKAEGLTLTAAIEEGLRLWLKRPHVLTSPVDVAAYVATEQAKATAKAPAKKRGRPRKLVIAAGLLLLAGPAFAHD